MAEPIYKLELMNAIEKLDEATQKQVETYAGLLFSPEEVVDILNLPEEFKDELQVEAAIRKAVIDQALDGSAAAQMAAIKLIDEAQIKNPSHE
jgi:hypothetical protein